jgi:hypothetical protein
MAEMILTSQLQQDKETTDILFRHENDLPNYHRSVTSFPDATFHNKWVGRGGQIRWPPRSPDLPPLDFHFWGYVKDKVYVPPQLKSLRKLRDELRDAVVSVDVDMILYSVCVCEEIT